MSLLKWKELAKSKSKLGDKINYVHDTITKHDISQQTSQESLAKVFKPVTSKLDDVIDSNLDLRIPPRKKRPLKKGEVGIDYMPEVDPYEDMDVEGLIDFGDYVPPNQEKHLVPKPPTYEEALQDILEGKKEFYVDPQYFPQELDDLPPEYDDLPPEYDDDYEIDYEIDDNDLKNAILDDMEITNYIDVDYQLNQPEMIPQKTKTYLNRIIKKASKELQKFKGYKANVTKKYNSGVLSEVGRKEENNRLDIIRNVLKEYIKHYKTKLETIKGSGIKGRGRKQRGGNVIFFNDAKQLLKKLELIIGERLAGNTSIEMRNMGVTILDTLLKMSTINRLQYSKLYSKYFKNN